MNRSFARTAACTLAAVAVTAALLAVPAATPSQAASFTVVDDTCAGFTWANNTLTCTGPAGGGGAGAPSGCSISGNPGTAQAAPYTYNLTASCTSGSPTGWQWSAGSTATTANITGQINTTTTFKVVASNASGPSAQVSTTITIGAGGGGGGGGGNISCNGFTTTHVINATWGSNTLYYTANAGGFGPNDAVVVKFTTSAVTTVTAKGFVQGVEFSDPPTARYGALSDTPCDFTVGLPIVGTTDRTVFGTLPTGNTAPWNYFTLAQSVSSYPTLQPGTTYYYNIANVPGACGGSCNMQITLNKPRGS